MTNSGLRRWLTITVAAAALLASSAAFAGSYQVSCDVKAKKDGKKYSLLANHYNPKKGSDYQAKPRDVSLSVDGKTFKLRKQTKMGGLWFLDYGAIQVVYAGTDKEELERWAFYYGQNGDYIARVQCK